MPAVSRSPVVATFWKAHRWVFAKTRGRIGGWLWPGVRVLRLTTTGRKSGAVRDVMLTYLREGDAHVVVASYAGEPRHPAWYLNLEASPAATVQVGGRITRVRARSA